MNKNLVEIYVDGVKLRGIIGYSVEKSILVIINGQQISIDSDGKVETHSILLDNDSYAKKET